MAYQREDKENADTQNYWKRTRYEYDVGGNLLYKGRHKVFNAPTNDINYNIIKYTYDVNGNAEDRQITTGAWDDRVSLGW